MGDSSCLDVVAVVEAVVGPGVGVGSSPSNTKFILCQNKIYRILYTLEKGNIARRIMSVV